MSESTNRTHEIQVFQHCIEDRFTVCGVKHGDALRIGISICNPTEKNFVKASGRKVSLARAIGKPLVTFDGFYADKVEEDWKKATHTQVSVAADSFRLDMKHHRNSFLRAIGKFYHQSKFNH